MIAPQQIIQEPEVLPAVRDLLQEYPFLVWRRPEAMRHALRALWGIKTDVFAVEAALEALTVEGEVLA